MRALPLLAANALLAMAAALALALMGDAGPAVPAHLAFAVGVLPLILAAMGYFVPVLTRSAPPSAWWATLPWLAFVAGLLLVAVLAGRLPYRWLHVAAGLVLTSTALVFAWALGRVRETLGRRHPGIDWYLAALACLLVAVPLAPTFAVWPEHRAALRSVHLHLNLFGFIGLTAIGTLQVLLPTCAGQADPRSALRLHAHLRPACSGVLFIALGSALSPLLAVPGALLLGWVLAAMLRAFLRTLGPALWRRDAAAASLFAAAIGLLGILLLGIAHGTGLMPGRRLEAAFVVAFLMPLVSGAATHLLPLWWRPGRQTEWHAACRARLGWMSLPRSWALVVAGWTLALVPV